MEPWVIALVAVSAVLHLAWNVRLKTAGDPLRAATIGMLAASVGIVPLGAGGVAVAGPAAAAGRGRRARASHRASSRPPTSSSSSAAYKRGDLSVVYPLARGTAPLLAVLIGVFVFGERLGVAGSLGVIALLAGFLWLQRPWRAFATARAGAAGARKAAADSAILFALATGVMIATYTAIDRAGTRLIDVVVYAAILWATCSVALLVLGRVRGRRRPAALRTSGGQAGGRRRLADPDGLPVHPRRAQRGPVVGRGAVARIGDGLRRGLGLRTGWARRATGPRRSAGSARRCSSSAGRCCWRWGADGGRVGGVCRTPRPPCLMLAQGRWVVTWRQATSYWETAWSLFACSNDAVPSLPA